MPVPFDATTMKSWFETGDKPTQQQFADVIDTFMAKFQEAIDAAEAAEDAVTTFLAAPGARAKAFVNTTVAAPPVVADSYGVSGVTSVGSGGGTRTVRITFMSAFADTNYTFVANCYDANVLGSITVAAKNVAYLELTCPDTSRLYVVFFHS